MADRSGTSSSTIVLRREEWEAFVEDVSRLLKAHDELLKHVKEMGRVPPARGGLPRSEKPSLLSRVLAFLGLKP